MTEIEFTSQLDVDLVESAASDDAVLKAMLVSTLKDDTVETMTAEGKWGRINFLMKNRHSTPFEHGMLTFRVEAPIAVFREWHRHRTQSYNELSGRYTILPAKFYVPPPDRPLVQEGKPGHYTYVPGTPEQHSRQVERIESVCRHAYEEYEATLEDGIAKEVARGVLPVYTYSIMYATTDPRSWMMFLGLRTKDEGSLFPSFPMWEIERCACQVGEALAEAMPLTYKAWHENGRVI